jgi:hypothetical protein
LLIFIGITLAIQFSNWNDDRLSRELEEKLIAEILIDLEENEEEIRSNILRDKYFVAACENLSDAISSQTDWNESLSGDLSICRNWTSPYLSSAAFVALRDYGTHLISDTELRREIVRLYEFTYSFLFSDMNDAFWSLHTYVIQPTMIAHARIIGPGQMIPNDYEALMESNEFINMLFAKIDMQNASIIEQERTLTETVRVSEALRVWLVKNGRFEESP